MAGIAFDVLLELAFWCMPSLYRPTIWHDRRPSEIPR
jgi:hypothetical protein